MSVRHHRGGWEVRWRDADGRSRSKRFKSEDGARVYDEAIRDLSPVARRSDTARNGSGVYSYSTGDGIRWRFVVRRSDSSQTSKRGFTSRRAAADARRRLVEQVERREVVHTTETFGRYWDRWLARRRPYLEDGTWSGYEISGRRRLLPAFADKRLGALSVEDVRAFIAEQAEAVEAGELAAKTVNNALVTLVVCLNDAVEDGLIVTNPALRVDRLPAAHIEREYLRLHEIPIYLDSCSDVYRPLAEVLIGSGVRISEALALRIGDLELDDTGGGSSSTAHARRPRSAPRSPTASDRWRSARARALSCAPRSHGAASSTLGSRPRRPKIETPPAGGQRRWASAAPHRVGGQAFGEHRQKDASRQRTRQPHAGDVARTLIDDGRPGTGS